MADTFYSLHVFNMVRPQRWLANWKACPTEQHQHLWLSRSYGERQFPTEQHQHVWLSCSYGERQFEIMKAHLLTQYLESLVCLSKLCNYNAQYKLELSKSLNPKCNILLRRQRHKTVSVLAQNILPQIILYLLSTMAKLIISYTELLHWNLYCFPCLCYYIF